MNILFVIISIIMLMLSTGVGIYVYLYVLESKPTPNSTTTYSPISEPDQTLPPISEPDQTLPPISEPEQVDSVTPYLLSRPTLKSGSGKTYKIINKYGYPGNDLSEKYSSNSPLKCADKCDESPGCIGYSWWPEKKSCWFKKDFQNGDNWVGDTYYLQSVENKINPTL